MDMDSKAYSLFMTVIFSIGTLKAMKALDGSTILERFQSDYNRDKCAFPSLTPLASLLEACNVPFERTTYSPLVKLCLATTQLLSLNFCTLPNHLETSFLKSILSDRQFRVCEDGFPTLGKISLTPPVKKASVILSMLKHQETCENVCSPEKNEVLCRFFYVLAKSLSPADPSAVLVSTQNIVPKLDTEEDVFGLAPAFIEGSDTTTASTANTNTNSDHPANLIPNAAVLPRRLGKTSSGVVSNSKDSTILSPKEVVVKVSPLQTDATSMPVMEKTDDDMPDIGDIRGNVGNLQGSGNEIDMDVDNLNPNGVVVNTGRHKDTDAVKHIKNVVQANVKRAHKEPGDGLQKQQDSRMRVSMKELEYMESSTGVLIMYIMITCVLCVCMYMFFQKRSRILGIVCRRQCSKSHGSPRTRDSCYKPLRNSVSHVI